MRSFTPSALKAFLLAAIVSSTSGCAALQQLQAFIQPPRFEQDQQSRSEIRLRGVDGASVRIWTRVSNPNSFGLTLGTLQGTLHLEGSRAATVDFPFGLPLQPLSEEVVPIDLSVDFRDVPGLGQAIARAVTRQPIAFEIEGTIGVNAGRLGTQTLGPMTWLRGELR
ncbi:MAG TPA: LEA type 2 family protein [Vicinamibacterales bacterium]|nr:LEA type 2 family protein [Vicinamibacterales bacterium]